MGSLSRGRRAHSDGAMKGQPQRTNKGTDRTLSRSSFASVKEADMTDPTFFSRSAPILVLAMLTSCGANNPTNYLSNGGAAVENSTLTKLSLTSDAFQQGQPIPAQYTCDGANQSPPLKWSEPPEATKSFAIVVDDT